jgi:hypothetical protein
MGVLRVGVGMERKQKNKKFQEDGDGVLMQNANAN